MNEISIRNFLSLTCIFIITAGCSTAFAETGIKPDPNAVITGKALYEKHCQGCHQKDGVGQDPIPWGIRNPEYIPAMPLNETSHAWHHGDEQLMQTILNGIAERGMPSWRPVLSDKEALDIVAYIKSLWPPNILACQGPKHMSCM